MDENLPLTPVPPAEPPPPKRFPLKLIILIALVVAIFFAPIPFYVGGDKAVCLGIGLCPRQGWNLGPSLWQKISGSSFSPQPAADETANWKTYTNQEAKYSFQYPAELVISGAINPNLGVNSISLDRKGIEKILIEMHSIKYDSLDSYLKDISSETKKIFYSKEKLVDGVRAVQRHELVVGAGGEVEGERVYILNNGTLIRMYLSHTDQSLKDLEVILSTFKFLESIPSPTCRPRPACLDAEPVICLIVETDDMCPPSKGKFCGGIAGRTCPEGYKCQLDGSYPDAGGKCVKGGN